MNFDLDTQERKEVLDLVLNQIEDFYENTKKLNATPELDIKAIRDFIYKADLEKGLDHTEAVDHVVRGLEKYMVHITHPGYFGLYNPRANFASIIGDLITAAYNPQMAAWSHAPFAAEVEARMIQELGLKFGWPEGDIDGVFTSGGAEANLTAVLCALTAKYPSVIKDGVRACDKRPVIICSAEAHHSVQRAARVAGLGQAAVQPIPTNEDLQMDVHILENELAAFAEKEEEPFMLIATAGTTGQGTLDDLQTIGAIARKYNLWYHVDGAYGGASILSRRLKDQLKGIEQADSITFDAHKWMSVPMGAGIFITAHPTILGQTFSINTEYMPKEASEMDIVDPYTHSIQWSRRFIGLKVYMSLLFFGWEGYEKVIDHQTRMGDLLREKLKANGWTIKNNTVLPVICFTDQDYESDPHFTKVILANILAKGRSWISMYPVKGVSTFRACITNYATTETELDELVADLNAERDGYVRKG